MAATKVGVVSGFFSRTSLTDQLRAIEESRKNGTLELPEWRSAGRHQPPQNLLAEAEATKGDLLRFYGRWRRMFCPPSPIGRS